MLEPHDLRRIANKAKVMESGAKIKPLSLFK